MCVRPTTGVFFESISHIVGLRYFDIERNCPDIFRNKHLMYIEHKYNCVFVYSRKNLVSTQSVRSYYPKIETPLNF